MATQPVSESRSAVSRLSEKEWPLTRQCDTITSYWVNQWGTMQLALIREKGGDELADVKRHVLRKHQRAHFLEGLEKMGISRDMPPAIVAARYHYMSNQLGTLRMEYIEESPKKVW